MSFVSNAQLPDYLSLKNPTIVNNRIASGGMVWSTSNKDLVLSVNYPITLTLNSIYFSDSTNTYIHSNTDGQFIAQIPGKKYSYNIFSSMLWKYSNGTFMAYDDTGTFLVNLTLSGSNVYPFQNEIRYIRNNSVYSYLFTDSNEQLAGNFVGAFSSWFLDGEHFLTVVGSTIRVYDKDVNLIRTVNAPTVENTGGSGNYFWSFPTTGSLFTALSLYKVNDNTSLSYPTGTLSKVVANSQSIAILKYGVQKFSIITLNSTAPTLTLHNGAGPYLKSYNSDLSGNWSTANEAGVVNYGTLTTPPEKLNLGSIRSMFGNANGDLAIASSSGHVLLYNFTGSVINDVDTLTINSSDVKLSQDGKYLAAGGNTFDDQYSEDELSLYVYDLTNTTLVKKWYYNYFVDASPLLFDYDLSANGAVVTQKTGKWTGSSWNYGNFRSTVIPYDSVFISYEDTPTAPMVSSAGNYALTSIVNQNPSFNIPDVSKLYDASGTQVNTFTGFLSGWIDDTRFIFNRMDSIKCLSGFCRKYYSPHVYTVAGSIDGAYVLPDSTYEETKLTKVTTLLNAVVISESEVYANANVIDIKTGAVLFAFDTIPSLAAPLGSDYIAYIKNNSLKIINWRALSQVWYRDFDGDGYGNPASSRRVYKKIPAGFVTNSNDCNDLDNSITSNVIWYRDADGDGFGTSSITQTQCEKPNGFVSNSTDCNDLDNSISFNVLWYRDADGDGFGTSSTTKTQCEKPTGFVSNNTDCDDSDADLTPLNACIVTSINDPAIRVGGFPNPSNGVIYVKHNNEIMEFRLIKSNGQHLNLQSVRDSELYAIDLSKETAGIYLLKILTGNNSKYLKIIKK
jgi:hypothetical protein